MADKKLHSIVKIDDTEYEIVAAKVAENLNIKVGDADPVIFDGSESKTVTVPAVPAALKNPASLTIQGNGTTAVAYDGSNAKTLNIKGSGLTTVTADASGNITISSTGGSTGGGNYLGAVSALTSLSKTAKEGDFYRVSTLFDIPFSSGSEKERAYAGDILIAIKDNPPQDTSGWDVFHTDSVIRGIQREGNGNAVTNARYDTATGVLTLVSGTTFATISHGTSDPTENTSTQYYFKY